MSFLYPVKFGRWRIAVEGIVAVLGILAVVLGVNTCTAKRDGRAEARIAALRAVNDSLIAASRRVDTVYVRDTLRLTMWRTRLDTLRDSLTITDTVEVLRYIAVADSTIAACTDALRTCEARVAVRDERIVALERLNREMRSAAQCTVLAIVSCPSRTTAYIGGVVTGVVGLLLLAR